MKLSTKGRYAVMAMADIALNAAGKPVPLADVANRQAISQEYLEQLFAKLRRARLVESARGPGGGYTLSREPDEIRIAEIVQAVDEPLQVTRCQGDAIDGCVNGEKCVTHALWAALSEGDREERSRKNFGRFLKRWDHRHDLARHGDLARACRGRGRLRRPGGELRR